MWRQQKVLAMIPTFNGAEGVRVIINQQLTMEKNYKLSWSETSTYEDEIELSCPQSPELSPLDDPLIFDDYQLESNS